MVKNNEIKYLATDMDGTLLDSKNEIMPKTKEALIKLQREGIKLIIATGRPLSTTIDYAKELEMEKYDGIIISNNGALVVRVSDMKTLYEDYISVEQGKRIFATLENFDVFPYYRDDKYMYVQDAYNGYVDTKSSEGRINVFQSHSRIGNYLIKEVRNLRESLDIPVFKIMAGGEIDYIAENISKINEQLGDDLYAMETAPFILEFTKKGTSKGYALKKLGIDLEKTIAFGDSMNDYHMIEEVKYGIAMENAMDKLKIGADDITDSNCNEGIYKALKKYNLIEE